MQTFLTPICWVVDVIRQKQLLLTLLLLSYINISQETVGDWSEYFGCFPRGHCQTVVSYDLSIRTADQQFLERCMWQYNNRETRSSVHSAHVLERKKKKTEIENQWTDPCAQRRSTTGSSSHLVQSHPRNYSFNIDILELSANIKTRTIKKTNLNV